MSVDRPAPEGATLRHDDALRTTAGDVDLCGDGVGLVLEHDEGVLGEAAHPAEQDLLVAADELRSTGEVGVESLHPSRVERQDVVLPRLDEEEVLQLP